jgi:NTE family protein
MDGISCPERPQPVHLALQGGGAHGALTWGVLDRLLEAGRFEPKAISGTSAGAMNAVALADGYARGGPEGARERLEAFWRAVGEAARLSPMRRGFWDRIAGRWSLDGSPGYLLFDSLTRVLAPDALNPLGFDPLRQIVGELIDFDLVAQGPCAVHIAATDVQTGLPRVFSGAEVGVDALMASACLPQLRRAVEIDGEHFWDGGFSANPALLPLAEDAGSRDIILVQLNPIRRDPPVGARSIINRMNEIGFNAPLIGELRALAFAEARGALGLRLHRICGPEVADMSASSKLDADWSHLQRLFDRGRSWADAWLASDAAEVGVRSSFDPAMLLAPPEAPTPPGRPRRWLREAFDRLVGRTAAAPQ